MVMPTGFDDLPSDLKEALLKAERATDDFKRMHEEAAARGGGPKLDAEVGETYMVLAPQA